jgi:acyl carrier protein
VAATSIAWGPWGEAGMAARSPAAMRKLWQKQGLAPLPLAEGLNAIPGLLAHGCAALIAVNRAGGTSSAPRAKASRANGSSAEYLQCKLAEILDFAPGELPALDAPLKALGVDSLTALEVTDHLTRDLGVDLDLQDMFSAETLGQLAEKIDALRRR